MNTAAESTENAEEGNEVADSQDNMGKITSL